MADDPNNVEPIVIVLENSDNDNVKFENDDIVEETLIKIGKHLSDSTKENFNSPSIKQGYEEISLRSSSGKPAAITNSNSAEENYVDSFISEDSKQAVSSFDRSSNSGQLDYEIRKGKVDSTANQTIGDLIQDIGENGSESKIAAAVKKLQEENNRYSDDVKYIQNDQSVTEDDADIGRVVLQQNLGTHTPRKFPNAQGDHKEIVFGIKKLKNLGIQTLLEASGEYFVPDDTEDFASVVAAKAASSAPGLARLGVKIPVSRFSAATIAEQVDSNFRKNTRFPDLKDTTMFSHGNVNNPLVPFDAISSTSSGIAAVLLTLTISALVKALAASVGPDNVSSMVPTQVDIGSQFGESGASSVDVQELRKARLGRYLAKNTKPPAQTSIGSFIDAFDDNFFLLIPTQHPYDLCVTRGAAIFFGESGTIENQLIGAIGASVGIDTGQYTQVSQNPGYFNTLLRMLIKSTTQTVGSVANTVVGLGASVLGESNPISNTSITPSALDINRNIGLEDDPTNALNVLDSVRDSKIFKFMQVLANLGDISLMIDYENSGDYFESTIDGINDYVDLDDKKSRFPNPAALVKKNRLSSNLGARFADNLAWGSSTIRSMHLLPASMIKAEREFTGDTKAANRLLNNPNFSSVRTSKRLLREDVLKIEEEIDSCYMPFYFHDLRTNEIISFHAFIESITDSHNADYTETEGYGRIGKIQTYKNTNRSIGCSFRVVSTNKKDFSEMWHKINKLVMLLYPQYTAGREVSYNVDGEEKKFIQPFSQLISNSPVIRFRLGDLIKSNFSDIDLARLFGVGTESFRIKSETFITEEDKIAIYNKEQDEAERILNRIYEYDFEEGDTFWLLNESKSGSRVPANNILKYKNSKRIPKTSPRVRVKVLRKYPGPGKKYEVKLNDFIPGIEENLVADFTGLSSNIHVEEDWNFIDQVLADKRVVLESEAEKTRKLDDIKKTTEFFSPELNPVVKSFESVRGQGLPGVIKSLTFDWSDARWETVGLNDRAPMWCKIDIEFSPINDINPGLDSSGSPIGMPYNIGSLLNILKSNRTKDRPESNHATRVAQSENTTDNKQNTNNDGGNKIQFGG